jgi:hypothetical protein
MKETTQEVEGGSPLDLITESFTETGLPAPIQRNLLKALGQLCTSAVEVPVAYLEGVAAEKKAESNARIKLIEKSANEISQQMDFDPVYAQSAVKKFGQRVIKEQINLDKIALKAVDKISTEPTDPINEEKEPTKSINDDWLNIFEKEASQKSTEEMQEYFSKILAGEITSPESFSIRTLKLLGEMDSTIAQLFASFCSSCMVFQAPTQGTASKYIIDARLCSLGGSAASNGLQDYGFNFSQLNLLAEYGLIITDYNSWMDYSLSITGQQGKPILPFSLGGKNHLLVPSPQFSQRNEFKVSGVALSKAGKELLSIVSCTKNPKYEIALSNFFKKQNLEMVNLPGKQT